MCTVTFVSSGNKSIITSNRDEQESRAGLVPEIVERNGRKIAFPKDPKAGGTWFAVNDSGSVVVLLNGARERHQWNPPYARSRGLVVLEIISAASQFEACNSVALEGVEPFTVVLFEGNTLHQMFWDGSSREIDRLDTSKNHIWSSSMLYEKPVRKSREQWFGLFMSENDNPTQEDLFRFHRHTEPDDPENGLVINRSYLRTISITQSVIAEDTASLRHLDLITGSEKQIVIRSAN